MVPDRGLDAACASVELVVIDVLQDPACGPLDARLLGACENVRLPDRTE